MVGPVDLGLAGRVCLVTGSTAGIGLETARLLAAEGGVVVVSGRTPETVERARSETGAALGVARNLAEPDGPRAVVTEAERAFGRVDCLVNNVGVAHQADFEELSDEDWDEVWQLNVMSYVRAIRAVVPGMR